MLLACSARSAGVILCAHGDTEYTVRLQKLCDRQSSELRIHKNPKQVASSHLT